jgi:hypothetical protein
MRRSVSRLRRTRRGDFDLRLTTGERDILRSLPGQLRDALPTDDPGVARLFPPAYGDDAEREADYQQLVHGDLMEEHLEALRVMEETIDAKRLSEEQVTAWLAALNDLRLVLGTRLRITEEAYERELDPEDPSAPAHALFFYLGWLEEQVVEALAGGNR